MTDLDFKNQVYLGGWNLREGIGTGRGMHLRNWVPFYL